jgi:CheY-like chemotaxis protein
MENQNKTLLLVEDEILIAMDKQKQLENYGYIVLTINTGEKAIAISKENHEIDLILMDIDLGRGIDGTETAEIILMDKGIPIVFLSSHMDPEIVEKTEKITSYGYVVKSSSITVLDASIKMAFKLFNSKTLLHEEKSRSQAWLENSPTCTKIIDLNLNLQYMSAAGVRALKVDDITTLYGHPYPFSFYPEEFKALMTGNLKKVIETGEVITQEGFVYDVEGGEVKAYNPSK